MTPKSKKRSLKKRFSTRNHKKMSQATPNQLSLRCSSYEITDEPLSDVHLPDEVQAEVKELFEKAKKTPEKIIGRIEELISKYPNVPLLYNYASAAYSNLHDKNKSKQYVEKNYHNNPEYLFAKLNYAEICMDEEDYDKVAVIFDNKFDLKILYPHRDVFHISEVVNFFGVTGKYFADIGMNEQAEMSYDILVKLAPKHPLTKRLKRLLKMESAWNKFKGFRETMD